MAITRLETLFAFVDAGDELAADARQRRTASTSPANSSTGLSDPFGNIVAKAFEFACRTVRGLGGHAGKASCPLRQGSAAALPMRARCSA